MRHSCLQRILLYAHNSRCGPRRCLHGWPPNAGTENPTWHIPVNPHSGPGEQDVVLRTVAPMDTFGIDSLRGLAGGCDRPGSCGRLSPEAISSTAFGGGRSWADSWWVWWIALRYGRIRYRGGGASAV